MHNPKETRMERRHAARIPLDTPCLLTLLINYDKTHAAMLVDVSRSGVQLALSPNPAVEALEPGVPVTLKDVPAPLDDLLENVHGKIAWVGERCCGIKLNKELSLNLSDISDLARI